MGKEDFSIRHLFRESFLDYFHIDSAFHKSIVPLIFRPGYLTVEYLNGRRASYVQPFKMFLVVSLIYFLLGSIEMPQLLKPAEETVKKAETPWTIDSVNMTSNPNELNLTIQDKKYEFGPPDTLRKYIRKYGLNVYVRYKYPTEGRFSRYLIKKVMLIKLAEKSFDEILRHNASKLIFLLIPVAALLFKLIYLKQKRLYYDHLIFSLHFHTVVFLLFIVFQLIAILYPVPMLVQVSLILLYLFFAMKRMYSQSIPGTFGKMLIFLLIYSSIALPLFLILLTGVSLATY
jgi:hypothetical protein